MNKATLHWKKIKVYLKIYGYVVKANVWGAASSRILIFGMQTVKLAGKQIYRYWAYLLSVGRDDLCEKES